MTPAEALKRIHGAMDAILWRENQPQWGPVFAQVRDRIRVDATCDTAYIDDKGNITVGLDLASTLTPKQLGYVIAHEVSHPMLDHFQRMPEGADAKLWNIAGDAIINEPIFTDGGDDALPEWVVRRPEDYTGPLITEAIYAWLRRNPDKVPKSATSASGKPLPGAGCGQENSEGATGGPGAPAWGQIANQVKATDAIVRGIGKGSATCSVIAPAPAYQDFASLLRFGARQAEIGAGRSERTYARASRRDGPSADVLLPGYAGGAPTFAVCVDCSSSMNREWIARIAGEILKLAREFLNMRFYLIVHTSRVVWEGWINAKNARVDVPKAVAFGGGTEVGPAYARLAQISSRWDAILHFTDCEVETPWPNAPTRKLIIGAFGPGAFTPYSTPPSGTKVVPCRDLDLGANLERAA